MKKYASIIFILLCSLMNAQNRDSLQTQHDTVKASMFQKSFLQIQSNAAYEKSNTNQTEYNQNISKYLIYQYDNKILQQDSDLFKVVKILSLQQKQLSIHDDPKESQTKIPEIPEKTADEIKKIVDKQEFTLEDNTDRLFGPSQYDSRIEPLQLTNEIYWQKRITDASESVGIIIEQEKLSQISATIYQLDITSKLGQVFNLCKDEAFYDQPTTGVGTCFVFSEKSMLTANHVFERPLHHYVIVFGFKILNKNGVVDVFVDKENIYYPKMIIKRNFDLDIVEFSVDRKINRPVLGWEDSKKIDASDSEIYMIGYPSGLPMKIALNASITENHNPLYYYTSLDCFQGNSGSPVFNYYTHKVIGVLVSGEIDYVFNGNCFNAPLCKYPYCLGEKVIRIEEIIKQL